MVGAIHELPLQITNYEEYVQRRHSQLPRGIQFVSNIRAKLCTGCGNCYTACRSGGYNAISLVEGLLKVIMSKCIGCGICRAMCSFEAISLVRPSEDGQDYSERVRVCF